MLVTIYQFIVNFWYSLSFTLLIFGGLYIFAKKTSNLDRKNRAIFFLIIFYLYVFFLIRFYYLIGKVEYIGYSGISLSYNLFSYDFIQLSAIIMYAFFTYLLFSEMRETRKFQQAPQIVTRIWPLGSNITQLIIKNIGFTSAKNVTVEYKLIKKTKSEEEIIKKGIWKNSILDPQEEVKLTLSDNKTLENFLKEYSSIKTKIEYYTISGEHHPDIEDKIDLKYMLEGIKDNKWMADKTLKEEVHDMGRWLNEIKKNIKFIERYIFYLSRKSETEYHKKSAKLFKNIQKMRKMKKGK